MAAYDPNCAFCKIVNKELASAIIYSDQYAIAFRDINPASKGHTLVVPKKHYASIADMPPDILGKTIEAVRKVTEMLRNEDYSVTGFNILNCSGKDSGQSVDHFHMHVIPRRKGDADEVVPKIDALLRPK
ncbi:MAG: HIT domain-containing protein [Candidatus Marsarchaeota archaeon]|jgi:histidine triad (HIT) family protein|nr:HIT domain-containing protein [Candidatus Marsarchaeota archaeon]MCL5418540.1 HIT domain-containing protein [Candidatus Marsarchaeota archaeon]